MLNMLNGLDLTAQALTQMTRIYYSHQVEGMEKIPSNKAAILVYYHGVIPVDYMALVSRLYIRDSDVTNQSQKRLAVLQTMRESFGPDIVHGLSYPHGGFPDIVCCLRKARSGIATLPLQADFTAARLATEIVRPPPIRNGTWKVMN